MNMTLSSFATAACVSLLLLLVTGCELTSADEDESKGGGVVVANQGNFSDGNGSITVYDPSTMMASTMVSGLGSIVQSILVADGHLLVASNTGNRIDVFDSVTGEQIATIPDVPSPRYMGRADPSTVVVTSLFDNELTLIDLQASRVVASVAVGVNPEGVSVNGSVAYVANHGFGAGKTVSVVNIDDRVLAGTITVDCDGPRFVVVDAQAELLVVCTGRTLYDAEFNVTGTTEGAIVVVDPATGNEKSRIAVDGMITTAGPGQDAYYAPAARRLYAVKDQISILVIDTDANAQIAQIGPLDGDPIGAVAFREEEERLYVARVPGFTQSGTVTMLSPDGDVIGSFAAGVAPSHIAFAED